MVRVAVVGREIGDRAGRAGYFATGGALLAGRDDGRVELRFDAAFQVTDAAGATVLLSSRDALGHALLPADGDLVLGPLRSPAGAQSYLLPTGDAGRRVAWIYSTTFGHEVARALLDGAP